MAASDLSTLGITRSCWIPNFHALKNNDLNNISSIWWHYHVKLDVKQQANNNSFSRRVLFLNLQFEEIHNMAITCSELITETLEQSLKYVQS